MKGKEASGDPEGREAKSGLACPDAGSIPLVKKVFLLMYVLGWPRSIGPGAFWTTGPAFGTAVALLHWQ